MKIVWSEEVDAVLSVGYFMGPSGIRNWALSKNQAIAAIEKLEHMGVAILGGDVLVLTEPRYDYSYDNWNCEQQLGESKTEFVRRSAEIARNYIENYKLYNVKCFFELAPDIRPHLRLGKDRDLEGFDDPSPL